jgi:hypothetical protein
MYDEYEAMIDKINRSPINDPAPDKDAILFLLWTVRRLEDELKKLKENRRETGATKGAEQ